MNCEYQNECGGCCLRHLTIEEYQQYKENKVKDILNKGLQVSDYEWEKPCFLPDGTRRRAALAFAYRKGKLDFGFNSEQSAVIVNCEKCLMLTPMINAILPSLRVFVQNMCELMPVQKRKNAKTTDKLATGDILILEADNGLDVVLEADIELSLDQRIEIFDYVSKCDEIIRFSHRRKHTQEAEPIIEKLKPLVKMGGYDVFISSGTFLQASKAGENALTSAVMRYVGETVGKAVDLFCGVGTFSYPLARVGNVVKAYDSSESLLNGFKMSVNRQMLHNVGVFKRNLFKDPLEADVLAKFDVVVIDPPRAGAAVQAQELAKVINNSCLKKVVYISCNPHSFVNDANVLIKAGYHLEKIQLIDQFVYSNHSELAALFTK